MFLRNKATDEPVRSPYERASSRHETIASRNRRLMGVGNTPRRRSRGFDASLLITIFAFIAVIVGGGVATAGYFTVNTYDNCVVAGKDRTTNAEGQSQMRVYTENCGTFTIGDDWFRGNFMTADMYGSLQEGQTYDFEASGFRVGVLSTFPNIVSITEG